MRKSGWTVATALSSLALLLTACGGSSTSTSTSTTGAPTGTLTQGTASSSSNPGPAASSTSSPRSTANVKATSSSSSPKQTAQAQPSGTVSFPPIGTTFLVVERSDLGWVMATARGYVVYTYGKDSKGGAPTCTGSCAAVWAPVTGVPKAASADNFPGSFGVITVDGKKVITYNGYPLYTFVGATPHSTKGNGLGGEWHVIILSASDISGT